MYGGITRVGRRRKWNTIHPQIYRLPFGLVLKASYNRTRNESAALRFLEEADIRGINIPFLIDSCGDPGEDGRSFMVSTFFEGDNCGGVAFTASDGDRLVADLQDQFLALRHQTSLTDRPICNAAGLTIDDPRASWIAERNSDISSSERFFAQIWVGLDKPWTKETIRPVIEPLITQPTQIVFCHGDLIPRNLIFPGGVQDWRSGRSRVAIIDWEYAAWAPEHWDPLKSTLCCPYRDSDWVLSIRKIFPDSNAYLDAELLWREKSGVMLV